MQKPSRNKKNKMKENVYIEIGTETNLKILHTVFFLCIVLLLNKYKYKRPSKVGGNDKKGRKEVAILKSENVMNI